MNQDIFENIEHDYEVSADDEGQRLDQFLAERSADLSRSRLQQLIKAGAVRLIDGEDKKLTPKDKVKQGQIYEIDMPESEEFQVLPEDIPLDIVFEDADVVVVNKPAGMVVHPAPGHYSGTLVNALLFHCKDTLSGIGGVKRPGIVHRLDKDTSGLMVVAKNDKAHHLLSKQFSKRTLSRRYYALVWGMPSPAEGRIETPYGRHSKDRKRMAVLKEGGKEAITNYRIEKLFRLQASLVDCKLETGRTHQIRVHMSHICNPLVGDQSYAANRRMPANPYPEMIKLMDAFKRQALHAYALTFIHPTTKEEMIFECDMPADMKDLCDSLEKLTKG